MRKWELSSTSIPVARTGKVCRFGVVVEAGGARAGGTGESWAVIACMLERDQQSHNCACNRPNPWKDPASIR